MSMASMVDALVDSKRTIVRVPDPAIEYNSMFITADELSAFMHKFDDEIIGGLTTFYDVTVPYRQKRRGNDIDIKIARPQLSILSGTTPSNLMKFMPDNAWDQGFTSRVIMVFSDERPMNEDFFAISTRAMPEDMKHDLAIINQLGGRFEASTQYRDLVNEWRRQGQPPTPTHPKLLHYNTRRLAHLLKLSMVSAVDRGNVLLLTRDDFNRALNWMVEAEFLMPEIFKAGGVGADSKAMEEIYNYILMEDKANKGLPEHRVVNFAREKVPAHSVMRVLEVMERSQMIKGRILRDGSRAFSATVKFETL